MVMLFLLLFCHHASHDPTFSNDASMSLIAVMALLPLDILTLTALEIVRIMVSTIIISIWTFWLILSQRT